VKRRKRRRMMGGYEYGMVAPTVMGRGIEKRQEDEVAMMVRVFIATTAILAMRSAMR